MINSTQHRHVLLQLFYYRNQNGGSQRGLKNGSQMTTKTMNALAKKIEGMSAKEMNSSLTYLISERLVERQIEHTSFAPDGGSVRKSEKPWYVITSKGIHKIEGRTEMAVEHQPVVNITASGGNNVITTGSHNSVRAKFEGQASALAELREAVRMTKELSEDRKADMLGDIDTINAQLLKSEPSKLVLRDAWDSIRGGETIASLTSNLLAVGQFIAPLIG